MTTQNAETTNPQAIDGQSRPEDRSVIQSATIAERLRSESLEWARVLHDREASARASMLSILALQAEREGWTRTR